MSPSDIRDDGLPVISEDKGYAAYQLKKAGHHWNDIATMVGYASGNVAAVEVRRYITECATILSKEQREEVLSLELDRLDSLLNAVWDNAMTGDTKAVDSALKVINTRAKLLGLELLTQTSGNVTNNTVVVTGNSEDFIKSLKLVDEAS
jgi:hypothetical protein